MGSPRIRCGQDHPRTRVHHTRTRARTRPDGTPAPWPRGRRRGQVHCAQCTAVVVDPFAARRRPLTWCRAAPRRAVRWVQSLPPARFVLLVVVAAGLAILVALAGASAAGGNGTARPHPQCARWLCPGGRP